MGFNIYLYKKDGKKFNDKGDLLMEKINDRMLCLAYQRELSDALGKLDLEWKKISATPYPEYDGEFYYKPKIKTCDLDKIREEVKNHCGNNYRIFMVFIKKLMDKDMWIYYSY